MSNQASQAPTGQLKADRNFIMYFLLSFVTCGIYSIIMMYGITEDLNTIASRHDGKKSMNYILVILLSLVTFGIYAFVWYHGISNRIGDEIKRRGIKDHVFSSNTFWGWYVLGSLIAVGPIVYMIKFFEAINALAADYNAKGQ